MVNASPQTVGYVRAAMSGWHVDYVRLLMAQRALEKCASTLQVAQQRVEKTARDLRVFQTSQTKLKEEQVV